jgi:intracellular multiplication protein IcmK
MRRPPRRRFAAVLAVVLGASLAASSARAPAAAAPPPDPPPAAGASSATAPPPDPPPAAGGSSATAPPSPVRPQPGAGHQARRERARERAFERTEDAAMPMTPAQLGALIQSLETTEAVSSSQSPPEAVMTAEALDLNAARPPVVRVGQGFGTSLLFTDRTGKIWPITAYQGFNKGLFDVSASTTSGDKDDLPTVLVVQPVASRGAGNLVVALKGLDTPVVLTLALGQRTVDARKEYQLPLPGPNAAPEYRAASPGGVGGDLLNVLNGLPPSAAAVRVPIGGVEPEAMAWRDGDALYLRTVAEVYSPEYDQRASHPSGLRAYRLPDVPVLLVSFNGNLTELTLKE